MLSYSLRGLVRQPLRTLASLAGVAFAVALFASIAAFVDGSASSMTGRALAPVAIDLQVALTAPLAPPAPSIRSLQPAVAALPGVAATAPFASFDLGAGSLRSAGAPLGTATALFAFDPAYLREFPLVRLTSGKFLVGGTLISEDAARALGIGPGARIALRVPGRQTPLELTVSGVADFTKAGPLFASRSPDNQGEFAFVPNVVVVDQAMFDGTILPALRADAASTTPALRTPPVLELHVRTDRARYAAADPAAALVGATALRRTIERIAPGDATVIDNVSDGLRSAQGDVTLAKILFLFLGIPGVLLAAYLAHYAAGLLAEAERRELATLRARGAGPAHFLRALAVETAVIGALGAVAGLALTAVVLTVLFGSPAPAGASGAALAGSAALAVAAGFLTTALALYLPRRFALVREATTDRRELAPPGAAPFWLRARVDLALIVLAAIVEAVTVLAGGFKPTSAEGQSVSLSFYTLLGPLLLWAGFTLFLVRIALFIARRRTPRADAPFGPLVAGLVRRALGRRARPFAAGPIALALAVAFGTSLSLFVTTYARHQASDARFIVGADVRVTPSSQAPLALADATLAVPGVRDATAVIALSGVLVGSDKRALAAVDPAGYLAVAAPADAFFKTQTATAAFAALADPTAILISDELAKTFNVQAGDRVMLRLPRADGTLVSATFHAVGIFTNAPGFPQGVDLMANRVGVASAIGRTTADFFLLRTTATDDAALAAVATRVRALPSGNALLVQTSKEAFNQDQSTLAALNVAGLGGIETIFTALMSATAAAIFVTATMVGRRKEYVTLRALGMAAADLRRLLAAEAGLLALAGLAIGTIVGTAMATLFIQILAPLFVIPPALPEIAWTGLLTLAVVVLAGTAASTIAGTLALGRLRPVELLRED